MTKIVTITLANEPNYFSSPRAYDGSISPVYPQNYNAVAAIDIPYESQLAKAKYSEVLAYLTRKYPGDSESSLAGYVVKRIKVKNDNWQRRKKDGEIVFADYFHGRLDAGFTRKKAIKVSHELYYTSGTRLPFQIKPSPRQYLATYDQNGKNPRWAWSDRWVPNVGHQSNVYWDHIITTEQRSSYDENHKKMMLNQLQYGKGLIDDSMVTKALAELNGKELDILTEVMEVAKTANTIAMNLKRLVSLLLKFKRSIQFMLGVPDKQKEIAKLWLEYRYGIRPIIYSIESGLRILDNLGKSSYVRSKQKKVITRPSPLNKDIEETLELRCVIKRQYDTSGLIGELGSKFISADPLVTAWELMSFSFIVDWVFDVGSFLSAINTFQPDYYKQQNACFSIKATCNGSTSSEYLNYQVYTRYVFSPSSHITIPIQLDIDLSKILDLAALKKVLFGDFENHKRKSNNVH